tara:strand:+ start:7842 stop:8999 length:1158 start_codon:yes stop_codon:yes gene_type:complete
MAYYFLYPQKDSTIYSHPSRKQTNTGGDEILEIVKERGGSDSKYHPSRILIAFKNEEIQTVINNIIGSSTFNNGTSKVLLNLYTSEPINLSDVLNLEVFASSLSWTEGKGKYLNLPSASSGVTWVNRDGSINGTAWPTASFTAGTTGSVMNSTELTQGGGNWFTGSGFQTSQQFYNETTLDTSFDVTTIVQKHSASLFANSAYPDGIQNNGFLIKQPDSIETNTTSSFGQLKYFSSNTHTIYPPKLCFKWDDSVHNFQSSAKMTGELNVTLYRNKQEYNQNDEALFKIHIRDKYPTRTFTTTSNYLNVGYFTTSSFYSIRDAATEEEVIPFDDNFTKLSANADGMFFKLYMKGLQPERYYRVLFKHINDDGTTIYDDDYYFKVVR